MSDKYVMSSNEGSSGDVLTSGGANVIPSFQPPGAGSLPAGIIVMWAGLIAAIPSGWNLCDGTNGTPDLRDRFIKGTSAAEEPGATGGSATHTPIGTVSQPTFSGNALSTHSHGVGTYVPSAHAGCAVDDHASHTHTYTQVPNHVHVQNGPSSASGGLVGWTPDTSTNTSVASGYSTANPTGGVATGTTNGPNATLTHNVTQPSVHTMSGSSEAVTAGTPAGTVSQPTFTGDSQNTEPAYYKLAYIQKS